MILPFGPATVLAGGLLILFCLLFYLFWALWQRRGRLAQVSLRPLRPMEVLHAALQRAAEMGEEVHVSPGTGGLHQAGTAGDTLAGLQVVQGVAREALSLGVPVRATANDALVSLVAADSLERALEAAGRPPGLPASSDLIAQENAVAYAAGVVEMLERPEVQGNVLLGSFGEEMLLMGEVGAERTAFQVAGAARPAAASFLPLVARDFLLGEEIYAAGAYLGRTPARIVSLLAQDGVRLALIALIILGVLLATVGLLGSTPAALFQMSATMPGP